MIHAALAFSGVVALAASANAAIASDEITSLPLWRGALPSKQYSGFIEVDSANHRNLHYWFVESESDPQNDPVVLWLNGGPGCSSLDGYWYENGPLHLTLNSSNDVEIVRNEYTWAKKANMLYLEAPAGVGFSYSQNPGDYYTNDTKTADDNWKALVGFFQGFPEFANLDFYIAGESYAGVYIPTLAARVLEGNSQGQSNIKLKGILVGNGCTGNEVGVCSPNGGFIEVDYLHSHALFSTALYDQIKSTCKNPDNPSSECAQLLQTMGNEVGPVNIYDILGPCIAGPLTAETSNPKMTLPHMIRGPDECIDSIAATKYFNTPEVQAAIHVYDAAQYWQKWIICSSKLHYTTTAKDLPKNVYPGLIDAIRVTIFNGDADACVPYTDNEQWTSGMGYPTKEAWRPWLVDSQVAGYVTSYQTSGQGSFDFMTVKGAGHMVPQYKPAQALAMFTRFINNEPY